MPFYGYMVYEAERAKTEAEHRDADIRLGQRSAALTQLFRSLAKPVHALRRRSGTSPSGRQPFQRGRIRAIRSHEPDGRGVYRT